MKLDGVILEIEFQKKICENFNSSQCEDGVNSSGVSFNFKNCYND